VAAYEKTKSETLKDAEEKHKEAVALKHRLSRLVPAYEKFKREVTDQRHAEFEKRRKVAERELNQKMEQRRREVKERMAREKQEAEEAEARAREEEEREAREAEEKERVDAEKRERMEKEKAERVKSREYVPTTLLQNKHNSNANTLPQGSRCSSREATPARRGSRATSCRAQASTRRLRRSFPLGENRRTHIRRRARRRFSRRTSPSRPRRQQAHMA
jgi:translation initiation factor 3 subunit A